MPVEIPTIEEDKNQDHLGKEIKLKDVAELEAPIKKIIEKIKDRIDGGEYGLIIGDDASGRIPALILGNFIKKAAEQKGQERPNIIFIPGKLEQHKLRDILSGITGRPTQKEELEGHITKFRASKEKRILIVTDVIQSGFSLKTLIDLLKRSGYNCDVATIGIEDPLIGKKQRFDNLNGVDIISGKYRTKERDHHQNTPLVYEKKQSSGVYKNFGDRVSKTLKSKESDRGEEIQDLIRQSREDANTVTDHLVDWYKSLDNEQE